MSIAQGWYPDPDGKPAERYWDGDKWTEQTRPQVAKSSQSTRVGDSTKSLKNQYDGLIGWSIIIIFGLILFSCVSSGGDDTPTAPVVQETNEPIAQESQSAEIDYENLVDWVNGNNAAEYFNELAVLSFSTAEAADDLDIDRLADLMDEMAFIGMQMKMIKPSPDLQFNEYWTTMYTDLITIGSYTTKIRNLDVEAVEAAAATVEKITAITLELNDYLLIALAEQ